MIDAIAYWFHLVAAAIWIGSQVMMFAVIMPAVRMFEDPAQRRQFMRSITRRFGYLGWGTLVVLLISGIMNLSDKNQEYQPAGVFDYDFRYAWILTAKLILVAVVIALTAWHTFVHGPRLMEVQRAAAEPNSPADLQWKIRAMRQTSVFVSVVNLIVVLAIVYLVTLLQNFDFSTAEV